MPSEMPRAARPDPAPPPSDAPIRVAIVDDQLMVREGFGALLDAQDGMRVVASAADGADAVELVRAHRPDVLLLDIRMPRLNGLDAARAVLELSEPRPRIIMLTTFDLDEYVFAALAAGASGFLLKDASAEDLARAVRVVAAGDALLSPSITATLIADYARRPGVARDDARLAPLTERELAVMEMIARGRSNAEIAGVLFLAEQTVKTHVSTILRKLALRDRTQVVIAAYESGLVSAGR